MNDAGIGHDFLGYLVLKSSEISSYHLSEARLLLVVCSQLYLQPDAFPCSMHTCSGMLMYCCQVFTVLMMMLVIVAVVGKSQIESHCHIANLLVNRFKSFNEISNPI